MKTFACFLFAVCGFVGAGCGQDADPGDTQDPGASVKVTLGPERDVLPVPQAMWFHADGTGYAAAGARHSASFDGRSLWFGRDATNRLGLTTKQVSVAGVSFDTAVRSIDLDSHGGLSVSRASFVESFSNGFSGVEQSWTLPTKPNLPGDLVVHIAVAGQSFVGSSSSGLRFASGGFETTYSNAVWKDADGLELEVASKFENGEIVLRVPGAVVEASTYPAVLDPTIDITETAADAPVNNVPTGANAINAAVASSGTDYLAVWRDDRNGTDSDIFGMIITSAGAVGSTNGILIGQAAGGARAPGIQASPTVAFVNGSYLVVWQDFKSPAADSDLVAARVSTAGVVTLLGPIASTAGQETAPHIAVRGTQALVVYEDAGAISGRLYDGTNFTGSTIAIAAAGTQPSAAADPAGNYLVSYTDAASTNLFGQFVTSAGALSGAQLSLAAGAGAQELSNVAFAGGKYVAVWQNNKNGRKLFMARYDATGVTTDTHVETAVAQNGVQLGTAALVSQGSVPGLVCGATNCTVAWMDRRNSATTGTDVFAEQFNFSTFVQGAEFALSTETADQKQPAIALASTNEQALVVWEDLRNGSPSQITGTRVNGTAVLDGTAARIIASLGVNSEFNAAVARIAGATAQWLIAWSDSRGSTGADILGTRVNDNLAITGLTGSISNATGHQGTPAIGVTATQHLVVWTDSRNGATNDIFGSRVALDGTVLDPGGLPISTFANDQARPAIASDGVSKYLVVWQDRGHAADFEVYGSIVDANTGVASPEVAISAGLGDQVAPAVAFDTVNQQFVVIWQDSRGGANARDIFATRVSTAGIPLDPSGVLVSNAVSSQFTPKIAFGAGRFLAVWEDRRTGSGPGANIFGARLQIAAGGGSLQNQDPAGIPISVATGNQQRPSVGFVNTAGIPTFTVVWDDDRAFSTNNLDVLGTTVLESDATVGAEFSIANSADAEAAPQIGAAGPAQSDGTLRTLITYQRQNVALNAQRTVMRRVTFGVSAGQHISDGNNPPGNPKFFWLPPMANAFTPTGTFDSTLKARLKIRIDNLSTCDDNAVVTTTALTLDTVTLSVPIETYRVTIRPSSTPGLVVGNCYRVEPLLDGNVLGFRDTHVTAGTAAVGFKQWGPTTNQTIPFRMEQ